MWYTLLAKAEPGMNIHLRRTVPPDTEKVKRLQIKKEQKGKTIMKKIISLILAAVMVMALAACGGSSAPAATSASPAAAPAADAEVTSENVWADGTTVYFDVPAKAGGGTDLYTRYLTQALGELYPKVNFVVTNYDTTEVGREHAKNADPDGTTLVIHHGGWFLEYCAGSSNVNPKEDFETVGILNLGGPQAIIAMPNAPYTNFAELGEYIAAHPGEVVIGCSLGGASQAVIYSVVAALGEDYPSMVNWVQCSSEADKLTQTASGSVHIANCSIPNAQAYEADGKLTILGTTGPSIATLENMSELVGLELGDSFKTTVEQGLDVTWDSSYYVWAPKGTPENVCRAINEAICKATTVQSFIDGNNAMATYIGAIDYDTVQTTIADEWARMSQLSTDMGLNIR